MLYPFKFNPILTPFVWGGEKIPPYKGLESKEKNIGESWELSNVEGLVSVVKEGPLAGKTITELVQTYKGALVGEHVYANTGDEFPLLFKFIDALKDLSIQVHPNDALAAVQHPGSKGKTEMWYVIAAEPGAKLYSGLTKAITPEELETRAQDGSITDVLACYPVHPGDVFFLPAGPIHAICGGCFIAEIQQTSDLTWRIYDYGRMGLDGKPRQLHLEQAKAATDYTVYENYRTEYTPQENEEVELVSCPYFTTSVYDLSLPYAKDLSEIDSFLTVMCLEGSGTLEVDGEEVSLCQGETVLIPASADDVCFIPDDRLKLLTSYIR